MSISKKAQKPQRGISNKYLGNLKQHKIIYYNTKGQSYPNIDTKRKSLMPNPDRATVNCYAEMTCNIVRRSRATTSCHLQTGCHPQTTTTGVQSVVTLPTKKDSHAQLKASVQGTSQIPGTLLANVFKRNNTITRNIDNLKHIKYK